LAHRDSFHPSTLRLSRGTFYLAQSGTFYLAATRTPKPLRSVSTSDNIRPTNILKIDGKVEAL
jgi:hypothetical protein